MQINYIDRKQISDFLRWEGRGIAGKNYKRLQENFRGSRCVHYPDCSGGFLDIIIWEDIILYSLKA